MRILLGVFFLLASQFSQAQPDCSRGPGSLPDLGRPAGKSNSKIPIERIFVLMQENHSFDSYFGTLNKTHYQGVVDGVLETMGNSNSKGEVIHPYHLQTYCPMDPNHTWLAQHLSWNGGTNDGFVKANEKSPDVNEVMGYYEDGDLPFYLTLANQFAISDRYFSSALGPTFPNRMFLLSATSFGHVKNQIMSAPKGFKTKTIFDDLNKSKVSWTYYFVDFPFAAVLPMFFLSNITHFKSVLSFKQDLSENNLSQVIFMDPSFLGGDEHPPGDIQVGQRFIANRIRDIMVSKYWSQSAIFLTYDENGGFFDHVAPPEACSPDQIAPKAGDAKGYSTFDHLGYRVPFTLVSPYARRHYVSHVTTDHTSVLKFIETKFNLPALTNRDANADGLFDLFDFEHPNFSIPNLPVATVDTKKFTHCLSRIGEIDLDDDDDFSMSSLNVDQKQTLEKYYSLMRRYMAERGKSQH